MSPCVLLTLGILALLVFSDPASVSAGSSAVPANEDGGFGTIRGSSDPEEYFWVVNLSEDQELRQIDDRSAAVYYTDGEHIAFSITAGAAHDAEGFSVPTSLVVSGTNVVTRVIHHRAGNPAAGGAPFTYPISEGVGWEGGFHTEYIDFPDEPKPAQSAEPLPPCVVPGLKGRSLGVNRWRLKQAGCRLGAVRGRRSRGAKVVKQDVKPGTVLGAGAEVGIKLGG